MATLTFLGAAREVTGSCHRLTTANGSVLLDFGMRQGRDQDAGEHRVRRPVRVA
jgi:metallo-beta-lactamase family protein